MEAALAPATSSSGGAQTDPPPVRSPLSPDDARSAGGMSGYESSSEPDPSTERQHSTLVDGSSGAQSDSSAKSPASSTPTRPSLVQRVRGVIVGVSERALNLVPAVWCGVALSILCWNGLALSRMAVVGWLMLIIASVYHTLDAHWREQQQQKRHQQHTSDSAEKSDGEATHGAAESSSASEPAAPAATASTEAQASCTASLPAPTSPAGPVSAPPSGPPALMKMMSRYYEKTAKDLGVSLGVDFIAALKYARQAKCRVVAGDKFVFDTIMRAWTSLTCIERIRLVVEFLIEGCFNVSKDMVEELKKGDLEALLEEMAAAFPTLRAVFCDERDEYMSRRLAQLAYTYQKQRHHGNPAAAPRILAIVGSAHVRGVVRITRKLATDVQGIEGRAAAPQPAAGAVPAVSSPSMMGHGDAHTVSVVQQHLRPPTQLPHLHIAEHVQDAILLKLFIYSTMNLIYGESALQTLCRLGWWVIVVGGCINLVWKRGAHAVHPQAYKAPEALAEESADRWAEGIATLCNRLLALRRQLLLWARPRKSLQALAALIVVHWIAATFGARVAAWAVITFLFLVRLVGYFVCCGLEWVLSKAEPYWATLQLNLKREGAKVKKE